MGVKGGNTGWQCRVTAGATIPSQEDVFPADRMVGTSRNSWSEDKNPRLVSREGTELETHGSQTVGRGDRGHHRSAQDAGDRKGRWGEKEKGAKALERPSVPRHHQHQCTPRLQ